MLFVDRLLVLPKYVDWDDLLPARIRELYPSISALKEISSNGTFATHSGLESRDESVAAWKSWQASMARPSAEMFSLISVAERGVAAGGDRHSAKEQGGPYSTRVQFPILHFLLHYISSPSLPVATATALHSAVGEVLRYPGVLPVPSLPLWEWCDIFVRHFLMCSPGRHVTGLSVLRAVCFFYKCDRAEAMVRYIQPLLQHRVLQVAVTAAKTGYGRDFASTQSGTVLIGDILKVFEHTSFNCVPLPARLYHFETQYPLSDILVGLVSVFSPESAVEGSIELMYLNRNHQLLLREDELMRGPDKNPLDDQEDGAYSLRPLNFRRYVMSCWHTCKSITPERDNRPLADEAMLVRTEMVVFAFLQISTGNNPKGRLPQNLPDRCDAPTVLMIGFPPHIRDDDLVRGLKSVYDVLEMKFGTLEGLPFRADNDPIMYRQAIKEVGIVVESLVAAQFYMPGQSLTRVWIPRTALSTTFKNPLTNPNRSSNGFEVWNPAHGGFGMRGVRGSPSANLGALGCASPRSGLSTSHPNTLTSASRLILLCQDYAEAAGVVCLGCAVFYQGDLISSDTHPYVARLLWLSAFANQKSTVSASTLSSDNGKSPEERSSRTTGASSVLEGSSGSIQPIGLPNGHLVATGAFKEKHFQGMYVNTGSAPMGSGGSEEDPSTAADTPRQLPGTAVPSASSLALNNTTADASWERLVSECIPTGGNGNRRTANVLPPIPFGGQCEHILNNGPRCSSQAHLAQSPGHTIHPMDFSVTLTPHLCAMLWASSRAASLPSGFITTHDRDEKEAWKAAAERRDDESERSWKERVLQLRRLFVHMSKQRRVEPGVYPCQYLSHGGIEVVMLMHDVVATASPSMLSTAANFRKSYAEKHSSHRGSGCSMSSPTSPDSVHQTRQAVGTVGGRLGIVQPRFASSFEEEMNSLKHCHLTHSVLKKPRTSGAASNGSSSSSGQQGGKVLPRSMGLLHVKSTGGVCMLEASADLRSVSQVGEADAQNSLLSIQRANDLVHEARHITKLLGSTMAAPRGACSSFFSESFASKPITRAILGRSAFGNAGKPMGRSTGVGSSTGLLGTYQVLYGRSAMERDVVLGTAVPGATLRTSEDGYVEFTKAAASSNVFLI